MTDTAAAIAALLASPLRSQVQLDAPIGELTTYRVGGAAAALVTLENRADVSGLVDALGGRGASVVAIGRGSNLLVSDRGFDGIAVVLGGGFADIRIDGTDVHCGAAAKLPVVARTTVKAGLTGFEWAVGVPGSVGGAVRMNAGGHGAEIKDSLLDAEVLDLRHADVATRTVDDLAFAYRRSALARDEIVLSARLGLATGDPGTGKAEMLEIVQWRRDNQPGGQNAGSVFTNPDGDSAGRLIDAAGLKGLRIGSAEVSDKHANSIQADPGGRADDVRAVMREVQRRVTEAFGIELHPETHLIGFDDGD